MGYFTWICFHRWREDWGAEDGCEGKEATATLDIDARSRAQARRVRQT